MILPEIQDPTVLLVVLPDSCPRSCSSSVLTGGNPRVICTGILNPSNCINCSVSSSKLRRGPSLTPKGHRVHPLCAIWHFKSTTHRVILLMPVTAYRWLIHFNKAPLHLWLLKPQSDKAKCFILITTFTVGFPGSSTCLSRCMCMCRRDIEIKLFFLKWNSFGHEARYLTVLLSRWKIP